MERKAWDVLWHLYIFLHINHFGYKRERHVPSPTPISTELDYGWTSLAVLPKIGCHLVWPPQTTQERSFISRTKATVWIISHCYLIFYSIENLKRLYWKYKILLGDFSLSEFRIFHPSLQKNWLLSLDFTGGGNLLPWAMNYSKMRGMPSDVSFVFIKCTAGVE